MERIFDLLKKTTGLNLNESHKMSVISYVRKRLEMLSMSLDQYISYFPENETELSLLVDEAAINETYFFREEQQFEFLATNVLPKLATNNSISIWSAACSSGEEPLSLLALTHHLGIMAQIFASDIDTKALTTFRNGVYFKNSLRPDGMKFHPLLSEIGTLTEKGFTLSDKQKQIINFSHYNLVSNQTIPFADDSLDLIFIRNVFIYFDRETRNQVISKMERSLKPGGILMLSVNEIAAVDADEKSLLYKEHDGRVFYFKKALDYAEKKQHLQKNLTSLTQVTDNMQNFRNMEAQETFHDTHALSHDSKIEQNYENALMSSSRGQTSVCNTESGKVLITNETIASNMNQVLNLIFSRRTAEAREKLDTLTFRPEKQEYLYYARALICEKEGNLQEAKQFYEKACILNSSMWPSTYSLSCLYQALGENRHALRQFEQCGQQIEKYISSRLKTFDFLMESFSPEYFLELCHQNIRKLQETLQ